MTDALGDMAVNFINKATSKPFFMYLSFNAVHTPMEAKEKDLRKFKGHPRQTLAAMTWSLDENIGKIMQALENKGLRENSLIFFLSDNGGAHNNQSRTGPLKGWKGNNFEGGHRVPFVVSWPAQLDKNSTFNGLTSSLDIFKTSLAAANTNADGLKLDGANLIPYIKETVSGNPHKALFWKKLIQSAIRISNYKMVYMKDYGAVLYDLENDLGETTNLILSKKSIADSLELSYKAWESTLMKPLWEEGEEWHEVTDHIHMQLMKNKAVAYKDIWTVDFKNRNNSDKQDKDKL
jgi:arylsulfatase A-like enzyme